MTKHNFIENWIEKNFNTSIIKVKWNNHTHAILTDSHNDTLDIVLDDKNTLYVDGKPYCGIPSLANLKE